MKKIPVGILALILSLFLVSCAHPPDRYNTQAGAAIGAGAGALLGQAIGHNTKSTLIGLTAGTILGALVGNAVDQDYQAARDAAQHGKPVIYYDRTGRAVEAIPLNGSAGDCRVVRKRFWENGDLVRETVEEVCGPPVVTYSPPPPPPVVYYAPPYPSFSLYFGRPYPHRYYKPYPYAYPYPYPPHRRYR
jgi:hypothetical protein